MQDIFVQYIFLILIILALVMVANKLRVAYPIILVMGGLALSFTSAFSQIIIYPELVFFIFLPPLLYEAAWQVSWKEFWKWRRIITSLAFPIVIITSSVIAFIATAVIPGFTLALGFLLGGIISPPDAVSATTIMRRVDVPKSMVSILEGESLLNDASSLIIFRFAAAAVITGQFHFGAATISFVLVVVMGALIGIAVGFIFYAMHRWLPTTPSIEIILTLLTPYCMYYAAEHFHYSGVLAVVCGGLLLSSKRQSMLSYRSRIESVNVWSNIVFVLNGLIFMLIGLELPVITQGLGNIALSTAIGYGLLISLALIITRLLCSFGASAFTRLASRFITVADPNPGWKAPLVAGWAGMRGVVSLAMALSIPIVMSNGEQFPYRNLILFVTFIVILITLVFQGLTLPWLIRKVKPTDRNALITEDEQERIIQKKMAHASLLFLEDRFDGTEFNNPYLKNLHAKLTLEAAHFAQEITEQTSSGNNGLKDFELIYLQLLERQRALLGDMNKRSEFDEELIRKYLSLIDLEEFKLRERLVGGVVNVTVNKR
ncbi:MAG TPA: Na+/H+ antiporter [Flavisolibacter sp.]|nr:Na+/H+ antiporter [Flavisolibacter sp.]